MTPLETELSEWHKQGLLPSHYGDSKNLAMMFICETDPIHRFTDVQAVYVMKREMNPDTSLKLLKIHP